MSAISIRSVTKCYSEGTINVRDLSLGIAGELMVRVLPGSERSEPRASAPAH